MLESRHIENSTDCVKMNITGAVKALINDNSTIYPKSCLGQQQRKHKKLHFLGPLIEEYTGYRWISLTKANNANNFSIEC